MTNFGYTLMTEQSGPKQLVDYAVSAEHLGFDFEVSSDHYSPWLSAQGHAPNAWTVLGAVAHATERVELFTYVTCPTMRYHPAIVAQQAATVQILADGRFTLGLGSGENLNEHVVGQGWPTVERRQDMLREAIQIIRELFTGELVDWKGDYFEVDSARLWDLPDIPVAIAAAVSGERSVETFAPLSDHLIAVEPDKDLVDGWHAARQGHRPARRLAGHRADPDLLGSRPRRRRRTRPRPIPLVRRRLGGQRRPAHDGRFRRGHPVRPARGRRVVHPVRARPRRHRRGRARVLGGRFTDIALVQVGDEGQDRFLKEAAQPLAGETALGGTLEFVVWIGFFRESFARS